MEKKYPKLSDLTSLGMLVNVGMLVVTKHIDGRTTREIVEENVFWKSCNDYKNYYVVEIRPYAEAKTLPLSQSISIDTKLELTIIEDDAL